MRALSTRMRPGFSNSVVCASHIEAGITGLAGGGGEVGALNGAKLRTDEDRGALVNLALQIAAFGADQVAGPRRERGKNDPILLVRLLHAGGFQIFQDHLWEALLRSVFSAMFLK
jgi:hypothetical protein